MVKWSQPHAKNVFYDRDLFKIIKCTFLNVLTAIY